MSDKSDKTKAGSFDVLSERTSKYSAVLAALAISVVLVIVGAATPIERTLQNVRDAINSKPASGQIHLVEIDAKSLKALDNWPWPRSHHGTLVDRLNDAGVEQIVFDVDFSSRSASVEDQAFADAIARANGKVVLPTFRQPSNSADVNAELENLPIDILREQAFLGSVNVHPDTNGQVNSYPYGAVTGGVPRPSIGALLADASGPLSAFFDLDHSIEIGTIPAHSFVDIVEGRFDAAALKGKRVIVGATAIELGDRYATARFGLVPGVLLQALAGETLLAGMVLPQLGPWPLLLFAAASVALALGLRTEGRLHRELVSAVLTLTIFGIALLAEKFKVANLDTAPALLFLVFWLAVHHALAISQRFDRERHVDRETGLPNLAAWLRRKVGPGLSSVVVAEVANLDEILSTLGEDGAATFVAAVAERLQMSFAGASLHRIGRQYFCWELPHADMLYVEQRVENAAQLFHAPVLVNGRTIRATVCFGLAEDEPFDSARLSHKAMLAAKRAGETGARFFWHNESLAHDTDQSLFILSEFGAALNSGHVSVAYEPKFNVAQGRVIGAEALARWNCPSRGAISPSDFVPVLEREGLIEQLTIFVLNEVVASLEQWSVSNSSMGCAINVSATLLGNTAFVDQALAIIKSGRFDPSHLTVELTETAVLSSPELAAVSLARFAALGIRLSIDDYGTGQSTLSYLKNFSAAEIKIDQSFIRHIASSNANRIMVRSTIDMAHALGLCVVAEGVEDEITLGILKEFGCDMIQGWHFGKPVSRAEYTARWCRGDRRAPMIANTETGDGEVARAS